MTRVINHDVPSHSHQLDRPSIHDELLLVEDRTSLTAPVMTMLKKDGFDTVVDLVELVFASTV